MSLQVLSRGVVGLEQRLDVVDDPRLVPIEKLTKQSPLEQGQPVRLLPRIDGLFPQAGARDAIPGRLQSAPAQ